MLARLRRALRAGWAAFWAEPLREPFCYPVETLIAYPELCRTEMGQRTLAALDARKRTVYTDAELRAGAHRHA